MNLTHRIAGTLATLGLSTALAVSSTTPASAASRNWEIPAMDVTQAQSLSQKQGDGVTVAVLDTGVDDSHPALQGKVTQGPDFTGGSAEQGDAYWGVHGTAMAHDVLKVAPKAHILSLRAILEEEDPDFKNWKGDLKGKKSPLAEAIDYAVGHGADVISMSLGSDSTFVEIPNGDEETSIARAVGSGVPVLASAGNNGDKVTRLERHAANSYSLPAGYPGVIAVAATLPSGARAPFSTVHTYNDIAVPGTEIHSAKPGGGYDSVSGTSPACALGSGVVALMKSRNPKLTPAQTRTILTRTATRPPGGWNAQIGSGPINAAKAVRAAANPPATLAKAAPYEGKEYLAEPDGTPAKLEAEIHSDDIVIFGIGLALGVVMLAGGFLLLRRRKLRPGDAGGPPIAASYGPQPGTYGPTGSPGYPQAGGYPQANVYPQASGRWPGAGNAPQQPGVGTPPPPAQPLTGNPYTDPPSHT
ncbi:S8 family serine peptidase [Streptomyces sp. NPDC059897]|uniref:S8 family peptidase n=1 Tax=Streptomyces sp. NPDC059897 TaxID=3346994 RepID=UPI003648EF30